MRLVGNLYVFFYRASRVIRMWLIRGAFKRHGRNFIVDPNGHYSYNTIEVGDDVIIGANAVFYASASGIIVGDKVMFGPHVTIIAGDHNTSIPGRFMADVREKRPEDDEVVVIEDDVWVGANVTILKSGRLRRGCIVAAGALVTKEIPPYCIAVGVPARVLRTRFDLDTILKAEEQLYPPEKRLSREYLEASLGPYFQREA